MQAQSAVLTRSRRSNLGSQHLACLHAFDAGFARAVALRQARRIDRRPDEVNEIAAELIAAAWAGWPKFDPARGTAHAFVASCIMRAAVSLRRARSAQKRGGRCTTVRLPDLAGDVLYDALTAPARLEPERLREDMAALIDGLYPTVRAACIAFMHGAVNGRRMGRRLAVHRAELVRAFRAAGLGTAI